MVSDLAQAIIERIMTQHWDMAACRCWICVGGREAGCRPRERYLRWRSHYAEVLVDESFSASEGTEPKQKGAAS